MRALNVSFYDEEFDELKKKKIEDESSSWRSYILKIANIVEKKRPKTNG